MASHPSEERFYDATVNVRVDGKGGELVGGGGGGGTRFTIALNFIIMTCRNSQAVPGRQ